MRLVIEMDTSLYGMITLKFGYVIAAQVVATLCCHPKLVSGKSGNVDRTGSLCVCDGIWPYSGQLPMILAV